MRYPNDKKTNRVVITGVFGTSTDETTARRR